MSDKRRFHHPDAGKIVAALFKKIKPRDIRMDILLDIGLLLGSSNVIEASGYLCKRENRRKGDHVETAYGLWYQGKAVFAAVYAGKTLSFPVHYEGSWAEGLRRIAEERRAERALV